ncbi:AI-2E family transporter [Kocuria sp. LUK]|uniref:AI-2E family transporter n=1 Tax=Kocuria sp. LUK TaxID=2897828 RepID=UPI001E54E833|nr:AI-2E family transporter [Kocuria sp. LUK]MCD1143980.1 AI-2E family transporter [Kocuria sp. LUK]
MPTSSRPDRPAARSGGSSAAPLHAEAVLGGRVDPGQAVPASNAADEPAGLEEATQSLAPAVSPWADSLGRAGSRAAQTLLIAAVVAGLVWVLLRIKVVVIAAMVALILASAVGPVVKWLERRGWSNLLATLTAFLGILLLLGGVITGIVLTVRNQWDTLAAQAGEGWTELQRLLQSSPLPVDTASVDAALRRAGEFVSSGSFAGSALSGLSAAATFLTGLVLMVVILFFFLKDGEKMWNFTLRWFRGERRARLAESVDRGSQVLGGYVRGTALVALIDAVFIGAFLMVVGVPLALPLAVLVFVTAFIPVVGATVAGIIAALVALVTNGPGTALAVVGWIVLVNQIEGNVLQPVIMGRTLSLHALMVLLALTVGTLVGGIFGAILAVPYTAVAWAVIQVWTDSYQVGDDPVLGPDPVNPKDRVEAKATMAERWKYQRMRYQQALGGRFGATERDAARQEDPGQDVSGDPAGGRDTDTDARRS